MIDELAKYKFFENIAALPFVERIFLFGSRARGVNNDRSDIDLAIVCPKASKSDWIKVLDIIESADTLLKVDCIRYDGLDNSDPLKHSIDKSNLIIYNRY